MTDTPEARLIALSQKATPGPWEVGFRDGSGPTYIATSDDDWQEAVVKGGNDSYGIPQGVAGPDAELIALARNLAEPMARVVEAARAYLAWRDERLAKWEAFVKVDNDLGSPEWVALHDEPFDIDQRLDGAIRDALAALDKEAATND